MADVVKVVKSPNFDTNLDVGRQTNDIRSGLRDLAYDTFNEAKAFVPYATGATYRSMLIAGFTDSYTLSSINWQGTRYDRTQPNKTYRAGNGAVIPAGYNSGKFHWFDKGYESTKTKRDYFGGVIKK